MKYLSSYLVTSFIAFSSLVYSDSANKQKTPQGQPGPDLYGEPDLYKIDTEVVSAHAEFLYWTVRESHLDYAIPMTRPAWNSALVYAQGHYKTTKFDWNPGVRVALSYFNAPKFWEMKTEYTWFHSTGKDNTQAPTASNIFLDGTWPQIFTNPMQEAHSRVSLHYNLADGNFARVWLPSPHFRLKLLGGLTGTWMNQDWNIYYFDGTGNATHTQNKWDFWGAGIRLGTAIDWFLDFWNMYLTGKVTTAIVLGRYHNHSEQRTTFKPSSNANPSIPFRDAYYEDTRAAYHIQAYLGPSWQKAFQDCRVEIFAGYEFNTWFNVQEVFRSTWSTPSHSKETIVNSGNVSFDGLTTRLTVDF